MEHQRVDPGELRGAYMHQSVEDSVELDARIDLALERNLPTIDVEYLTEGGHQGTVRLLMLPGERIAQSTDAGVIYSFLLMSGNDSTNQREVTILVPRGGGRALLSLPY